MAWAVLFAAGLLEIGWAIGLKYTEGFTRLVPSVLTLAAMAASICRGSSVETASISRIWNEASSSSRSIRCESAAGKPAIVAN